MFPISTCNKSSYFGLRKIVCKLILVLLPNLEYSKELRQILDRKRKLQKRILVFFIYRINRSLKIKVRNGQMTKNLRSIPMRTFGAHRRFHQNLPIFDACDYVRDGSGAGEDPLSLHCHGHNSPGYRRPSDLNDRCHCFLLTPISNLTSPLE